MKKEKKRGKRCLHRNVYYDTYLKVEICADCGATPPTFTSVEGYIYSYSESISSGKNVFQVFNLTPQTYEERKGN